MEDEEDFTVDNITTGAGGNPFAVRSDFDLKAQVEQDRADLKAAYDRARGVLAERYRGPSQRELLLSLGQAFLTPTEGGSFREALPNVVATLAGYEGKRREAKSSLAERKAELDIAEAEARRKSTKDLYTLYAQYQRAENARNKPEWVRTQNPDGTYTLTPVYRGTAPAGTTVAPPATIPFSETGD